MKNLGAIIWGLVIISVGLALGGNALGIINVNIFFDGWWTLFIIVPCFAGLFSDKEKTGNIIGLTIGILLLLACRGLFDFGLIWKLLFPIIIVAIGLSIIIKSVCDKDVNESIKKLNSNISSEEGYSATFAGQDVNFNGEVFKGTNLNAVFGGVKLDLRNAIIEEDVVINATSVFGGIEIFVPNNVKVKVKSNSIFGGVSNKRTAEDLNATHTIYVNATGMFGGVDVK